MGPGELEELRRQIDDMIDKGWIKPSESEFGAPVLFVPKKGGKLRMCIDYRGLNCITRKNAYPLPRIDDLLDAAGGCKVFSKIDLKSGYHQIEVDTADQHKTVFKTRNGLYEFTVMPFGLTNTPTTFQSLMDKVLRGQIGRFVVVYLDDILIFSKSIEEHLKHLEKVLSILKKTQLHLNLEKIEFRKDSVIYLGHQLSAADLEPEATKVEVIRNWPQPANIRELRAFFGLASYYRKFEPRFSIVARPLSLLTSKNVPYSWDTACTNAFEALKEALVSYPVLRIADPKLTFVVTTDASQYGICAVLQQDDGDGLRPLEFYSKRMPNVKVANSTYTHELYALRRALDHWKHYLLGRHFKVFSDHETLKWIKEQSTLSPTLIPLFHEIDIFDFELRHKKGCYNRVVDALSCHPEYMTCLVKSYDLRKKLKEELVEHIAKDLEFSLILEQLRADPRSQPDFHEYGGLIFSRYGNHDRLCVPNHEPLRTHFLDLAHGRSGHFGMAKTYANLLRQFDWPGMKGTAEKFVAECQVCQRIKPCRQKPMELLTPLPIPEGPRESVSIVFTDLGKVALLRIPEANADRFEEELVVAVAALVRLRTLENLESRVTALEQRSQELQAEITSLKQSQLSVPRPPNPRSAVVPVSQSNTVLTTRASGTVASAGTGASSSSGSADSSGLVIVPTAGTSAQNATVLTDVQYSGPMLDKRAATLPSKYDGKADITSWISSMRSYFEVMRTPQEDRSMIMGTNTEPAVRNHIELQAVAAGYERIDLTEWLKVTPVRTLEDLLLAWYQDKHAALKARLKLEALKGQTWRSSMQALEQHLTGLFTTPDLGMTNVSCMDVFMGVAPKEYLSLLALKDHTTWQELMTDLVNLEAKDLARQKKAPAAGGKPQRKRFGSSNQLALHDHREAEDQSYADDLSLDDDLEPDSDTGCSTSAIESDVNEDEKLNAFRKTASNKGPNRGSGLFQTSGKQQKGVEESSTLPTTREAGTSVAGPFNEPEFDQLPTLEAWNDAETKAAAIHELYTEPWEESREGDFHAHVEHWLQLKQQRRVQGSVELTFFKLLINRRYIRVLIDRGSTTNFFSPNGIRKGGLGMKQVELQNPCQTQVGNQEVVTSTHAVKGVRVTFDKNRTVTHELNFYGMDKCPFDAVIGLGWLKAHCLRTSWADNRFVVCDVKGNERTILLDETRESPVTLLIATKFCRSMRRRKEIEHVHIAFVKPIHVPSTFAAFSTSIEVDPSDQHKMAFKIRDGLYEFIVMPFGLMNAPATFQWLMDKVLRHQLNRYVVVYLDNILIFSKSMEEHVKHLEEVLQVLKEAQLHLNLEKSEFGRDSVIYLGHRLSADGLEPEVTKVEVIREWPQPANVRELRSFLGLASYYRKFVPKFSVIAHPLSILTRKNVAYAWCEKCETAFQALKEALVSHLVLHIADPNLTFVVTTDASQFGIGAVLQQDDGDGLRPLEYYSKRMPRQKVCQRTKVHRHKPYGLLRPLPIPDGPGESISIDFTDMGKLSEAGNSQVMVIVDRFSKFLNLIPLPPHAPTELVIEEFHQQYILQSGVPKTIVSDRDTRFISKDWKDFTSQMYDIKLNKTSGRHPEANGLAEEINQTVIQLLRALIVPDQNTWDKELHKVKGLYNNSIHSATGVTPNQLQYGWPMPNPLSYVFPEWSPGLMPGMPGYNAKYTRLLKAVTAAMNKRQHAMIKHANKLRKEEKFKVGDYVWVKMSEFSDEEGVSRKLLPLYYGPWQILKVIGDDFGPLFVIDVPPHLRMYPVFHPSKLFPHIDDETFPFRDPMIPRSIDGGHEIDRIVSHEGRGRNRQYKVHFLYHPLTEFFWIDRKELLKNVPRVVNAYERQIAEGQTAKFVATMTPHGLTKSLFLMYSYDAFCADSD
ncbi:hypothetical protein CBR_g55060 [Chara braunii]|uniref:Reverse transcriptase n=1 Tax=Chara braunii TaxID=69332 RepID=A0A388MCK2_CHABU|nr:hypothetical protein CBR_g55060 [Chara braunii]|eukprot:GBG92291.1 hypothetical protein CBR_g55060 [Chara braunii]